MPFKHGKDKIGTYIKWGDKGKKYYYDDNITATPVTPRVFSNSIQREISSQLTSTLSPLRATRTLESKYHIDSDDEYNDMDGSSVASYDNNTQMVDPYILPCCPSTSPISNIFIPHLHRTPLPRQVTHGCYSSDEE